MADFLSQAWLADLPPGGAPAAGGVRLTIQQRVTGGPDGEVAYVVRVTDDGATLAAGVADDADVTISEDWATAQAIHAGALSAAEAMASGRIRVGGAVTRLLEHAAVLEGIGA